MNPFVEGIRCVASCDKPVLQSLTGNSLISIFMFFSLGNVSRGQAHIKTKLRYLTQTTRGKKSSYLIEIHTVNIRLN